MLFVFMIATMAPSWFTPRMPLKIITNSKAHHSIHMRKVVGAAILMYAGQSKKDSSSNNGA